MEFFKLSRVKFGFAAALFLLLGACSFLPPFIDRQRNAGVHDISKLYVGRSTPENPAVCYNGWTTTYDEARRRRMPQAQDRNARRTDRHDVVYLPAADSESHIFPMRTVIPCLFDL